MISAVKGIVVDKTAPKVVLETVSGVFYEMLVSDNVLNHLPETGEQALVYTSTIIREQEMYLVGFLSQGEKNLFELIITAKGIGPKQAIKILGEFSGADLRNAIVSGDISTLSKIKGISTKKAEQLILDLREKIKVSLNEPEFSSVIDPHMQKKTELLLTMRALGYSDHEIKSSLDKFFEQYDTSGSIENLVKEFLSLMVANKL